MKRLLLLAGTFVLSTLLAQAEEATRVDLITTNRGKVYENCRILQVDPDGVMFTHKHGGAKILFSEMPPDMQIKLGYDRNKEDEYNKSLAETKRAKQVAMWEFRKEVARLQAQAQAVEAARLNFEAAQQEALASYGYGYGSGGLLANWYSPELDYYGSGGWGYGHGHGGWGHHGYRHRSTVAPGDGPIQFRSARHRHFYPRSHQVPFGVPAMGPLSPSMSPRTGNPGSIFPSR